MPAPDTITIVIFALGLVCIALSLFMWRREERAHRARICDFDAACTRADTYLGSEVPAIEEKER